MIPGSRRTTDNLALWIAQGFGVGRIPFAPGTFGTVLGFGWFFLLLAFGDRVIYTLGTILGIAVSVWCAGRAEKILEQRDPGSVVIDEIVAIPFCFWGIMLTRAQPERFYHPAYFQNHPGTLLVIFIAFRCFDILKPWPIHQSQKLPGGWGVTLDDLFAALYVNLFWLIPTG